MTYQEFQRIVDECLVGGYGEKFYPDAVVTAIWAIAKNLPPQKLRDGLQNLIETEGGRPPNPAAIRRVCGAAINAANFAEKQRRIKIMTEQGVPCVYCANTGFTHAINRYNHNPSYTYSFVCSFCRCADVLGIGTGGDGEGTLWNEETHADTYVIIPHTVNAGMHLNALREHWNKTQGMRLDASQKKPWSIEQRSQTP